MLPGLGEVDDVVMLLLALKVFVDLSPPGIVRQHLEELFGVQPEEYGADGQSSESYVDASYRLLDPQDK
jgi:hypothetical protein